MFDIDNWQEIWATIKKNRVRSIMTGFGVFWGILVLVILIGFGNSMTGGVQREIEGVASNSCFFWPYRTSEAYAGYRVGRYWSMNMRDIELLKEKARTVELLAPMLYGTYYDKNVAHGHKTGSFSQRGVMPDQFLIEKVNIHYGRLINEMDIEMRRKVCVIGKDVYKVLFAEGTDPIGEYIKVNNIYFQVVGVIERLANFSVGGHTDRLVFLPFTTMRQMFSWGEDIYFLACTAKSGVKASVMEQEVATILKQAHKISPTDEKALSSFNMEKDFERFESLLRGIGILTWIVGLGALLSGVIGISNIMLVTVRERMREIGVRRALGATPSRILIQIMSESFVLTAIAGTGGLVLGVLILGAISGGMEASFSSENFFVTPMISFWTAMAALAVLVCSGVIAGILPATKALRIKAIDAIRDE